MRFEFPTSRIQVFCKAPVIGSVKTRLIPYLGEHAATRLHERLAKQTIEVCKASRLAPIELWCMPDTEHDFFQQFADDNTSLHVQQGSELGERMFTGIAHALLNERADSVVLIGTDCPTLDSDYLRDALERLGEFDAVVGPAEDGGYCLIGLTVAD